MKYFKYNILILAGAIFVFSCSADARRVKSSLDTPGIHVLLPLIVKAIVSQDKEALSTLVSENPILASKNCWSGLLNNLDKDSWKAEAYRALAITSKRIGEHRNAVNYYDQSVREFKDLGEHFKQAGNYLVAVRMYDRAIDITFNNTTKHSNDFQWLFDTYLTCAEYLELGKDFQRALGRYTSAAYLAAQKLNDFESSVSCNVKAAECALKIAENLLAKDKMQDALLMLQSAVKKYDHAAKTSKVKLKNNANFALYNSLAAESYSKIAELYKQIGEVALEKKAWIETAKRYLITMNAYIASKNRSLAEGFRMKAASVLENIGMFEEAQELFK
ncbi:MAG: hypothetical protein P9X27_00880 [Candidatus Kaelpia aquatica]|nr:hypothetical protein [Candidatus Kaelpia aquatica]